MPTKTKAKSPLSNMGKSVKNIRPKTPPAPVPAPSVMPSADELAQKYERERQKREGKKQRAAGAISRAVNMPVTSSMVKTPAQRASDKLRRGR